MPKRTTRPLVDMALGGELNRLLREHGRPGPSYDALARKLALKGIDVSSETLRRWALDLEDDEAVVA